MSDLSRTLKESWSLVEARQDGWPASSTPGCSWPIRSCGTSSRCRWTSRGPGCSPRSSPPSRTSTTPTRWTNTSAASAATTASTAPRRRTTSCSAGRCSNRCGTRPTGSGPTSTTPPGARRTGSSPSKMQAGAEAETRPPLWHAEVVSHERRGRDIAVFTCRPLEPLAYQAGQHVSIECSYQPRQWRQYSVANAPRKDGLMEFHVRTVGAGWVSGALVRRLKPGDMLKLASPMGAMTVNRKSTRDIVCVAGGTGLAPVKAIVQELTAVQPDPMGTPVLRRPYRGGPLRPGRPRPAGRPVPVAVGGTGVQQHAPVRRRARATISTCSPGTARGAATTSSSPARP